VNELRELYREVILDHNREPRNFGELAAADHVVDGVNPLCGDKMTLYVKVRGDIIEDVRFKGSGCAISVASSSLMTERVKGRPIGATLDLVAQVHEMLTGKSDEQGQNMDKLAALAGVREFPSRVKCASLAWHALKAALTGTDKKVSTE
jgi:nitrogen fixation NifU-like protein